MKKELIKKLYFFNLSDEKMYIGNKKLLWNNN